MTTQPAIPPDDGDAMSPEAARGEPRAIFDRGHHNERRGHELVAASPVPDTVVTLDRAIAILSLAYHEVLNPETSPERLYQLRTEVDALHALLVKFRYSDAAANSAAALRIVNEREIGRHLRTLERQPGSRSGPSEYGAELKQHGLSYPLAARWQLFAQASDALMDEHLGSALEMLEHGFYIDEQDPELAAPGPQISSTWFERQVRSAMPRDQDDGGAAESAGDVVRAASDAALGWSPPELLLDHARSVLGGLDRVVDWRDLADRDWSGRLLVVPPSAATIGFSDNLLARFSAGHVEHAILVVPADHNAPWWNSYAGWPVCLLARAALEDLPPGPLSAFCVSNEAAVQARFRARFEDLGYVYPGARYGFRRRGVSPTTAPVQ